MGKAKNLTVLMNGIPVGRLNRSAKGIISFGYDEDWLSDHNRRPLSLSLPLTTQVYSGVYQARERLINNKKGA